MLRLIIILTFVNCTIAAKLDVVQGWKYIDYLWESEEQKENAISDDKYNISRIVPYDLEKVQDGRIFITTPVLNFGVPATLSTVSEKKGPGGPLLEPYPNWPWHNAKYCEGITNVFRIAVDECNRLWVLDNGGFVNEQVCPAQYLVFDLNTDELLQRIQIPDNISHGPDNITFDGLSYPIVETYGDKCTETWAYATDLLGGGLVIYNGSKFWRRDDDVFRPDRISSSLIIGNETLPVLNVLTSLALTPGTSSPSRRLFFRPETSLHEYSVAVDDLQKSDNTENEIRYTTSKLNLPSPVIAQVFSQEGILFFGLTKEIAIGCWNLNGDDENVTIVAQDDETLQVAFGVKIRRNPDYPLKEELWALTNRAQKIRTGTINFNEINFRVLSASVDDLVEGTECQLKCNRDAIC